MDFVLCACVCVYLPCYMSKCGKLFSGRALWVSQPAWQYVQTKRTFGSSNWFTNHWLEWFCVLAICLVWPHIANVYRTNKPENTNIKNIRKRKKKKSRDSFEGLEFIRFYKCLAYFWLVSVNDIHALFVLFRNVFSINDYFSFVYNWNAFISLARMFGRRHGQLNNYDSLSTSW